MSAVCCRIYVKAFFLLVILVPTAAPCYGQSWEPLHGPYSGEVVSTLVTTDGTVFAGTFLKGLFYRHPDVRIWVRVESRVFDGTQIRALAEFNGTIFAGTAVNGIFRSADGGVSWEPFSVGLLSGSIYDFLVSRDNRLYAATSRGLVRYVDGDEWHPIQDPIQGLSIRTVAENTSGDLFVGAFAVGVFRSTNGGDNWEIVNNGLATTTIRSMTVGPENELFLGSFGGDLVQRSFDNGNSWSKASNGLLSTGVWSVEVAPDGRLFAGSRGQGISYSDDNGDSWHTTNAPQATVSGFAFLENGEMLAASQVGLLRSRDGGDTWWVDGIPYSRVNQLLFSDQRLLAGTALGGIHYSDDLGVSWIQTNVNAERVLSIAHGGDGRLYGGTLEGGAYRSDDGADWTPIWRSSIHVLYAIAADSRGFVFVGTEAGVYRLDPEDPDRNWELLSHPDARVWTIVIDDDDVLYSGTEGRAIWRSTDGGDVWTQLASDFAQNNESIFRIALLPDGRVAMAPSTQGGVWISEDGGESWDATIGLTDVVVADMTIGPLGSLVAAGFVGQIFELASDAAEWSEIGPRFNITPIRSVAAGADGTVYVGTDPVGVHQLPEALSTEAERDDIPENADRKLSVYPNPAAAKARVSFEIDHSGSVRLEVVDALGRLVQERTISGISGDVETWIDTELLVRGTYFVRVTGVGQNVRHASMIVAR